MTNALTWLVIAIGFACIAHAAVVFPNVGARVTVLAYGAVCLYCGIRQIEWGAKL